MAVLYRHIRLDTNTPFYIGIGQDEKRAYDKHHRNDHWKRIVKKHGYKVHIMMDDLTWEEACQKEIEFIQLYGRKDLGLGTLVNMTDGGDGNLNPSKETRTKICIGNSKPKPKVYDALRGRTAPHVTAALKGKPRPPRTAEHCANISASKKAWWAERKQKNQ